MGAVADLTASSTTGAGILLWIVSVLLSILIGMGAYIWKDARQRNDQEQKTLNGVCDKVEHIDDMVRDVKRDLEEHIRWSKEQHADHKRKISEQYERTERLRERVDRRLRGV
jgi:uncharacterized protein HemX